MVTPPPPSLTPPDGCACLHLHRGGGRGGWPFGKPPKTAMKNDQEIVNGQITLGKEGIGLILLAQTQPWSSGTGGGLMIC